MQVPVRLHQIIAASVDKAPQRAALIDYDGETFSYGQLETAVDAAEQCLRKAGVRSGDRVALVVENCVAAVAFLFAASRLDAWVIPINARLSRTEISGIIGHASPRVLVFSHRCSQEAAGHAGHWRAQEMTGPFGAVSITGSLAADREPVFEDAAKQVAVLLYTTGTTGDPKGVMLSHNSVICGARLAMQQRGLHADDHLYLALPLTHVFGLTSVLMAALAAGAKAELVPRFDPAAVLAAIARGITCFPGVPQMHAHIMSHAAARNITRLRNHALRYLSSGGAPLDPDWKARVEDFFGLALFNGYGLTETTAGVASTNADNLRGDVSVGKPYPGIGIKLDHSQADDADTGEVLIKGAVIMLGYYRNPEATAAALDAEGWFRSGDLGRFDETGNLHIVGRTKELIIRSGFNVYPQEVEAAINEHSEVVQCVVAGRPLKGGNEEVVGFIELRPGSPLSKEELGDFLKPRLAPYKRPGQYVFTTKLPAAATGKVLRGRLLEFFAEELAC